MGVSIVVTNAPTEADREAIFSRLIAFNDAAAGPSGYENLAVLLKSEEGSTIGGSVGEVLL
jgi:hypothetical protein